MLGQRTLKRVPLNFPESFDGPWEGYVNPNEPSKSCSKCRTGSTVGCTTCDKSGEIWTSQEARERYESWSEYEPPNGEGFQLWETTTEGSPCSPVFLSVEELAEWCAENATLMGSAKTSAEVWIELFEKEQGVEAGSTLINLVDSEITSVAAHLRSQ